MYQHPQENSFVCRDVADICLDAIRKSFSRTEHAQSMVSEVLDEAERNGDVRAQGWGLCAKGKVRFAQGALSDGIDDLMSSLEHARNIGDKHLEGFCLQFLGACHFERSEFREAIEFSYQAVLVRRGLPNEEDLANSLGGLGAIQGTLGNWKESADCLTEALDIARRHDNKAVQATMLSNMGELFSRLGAENRERALECFAEAAELARHLEAKSLLINCLTTWATVLAREQRWQEAESLTHEASEVSADCTSIRSQLNAHTSHAIVLFEQERFDDAQLCLRAADQIARDAGHEERYPTLPQTWGRFYAKQGQHEMAKGYFEEARNDAEQNGQKDMAIALEKYLSETCEALGDLAGALQHFHAYFEAHCALEKQSAQNLLIAEKAKNDVERARQEAELERLRNVELAEANRQKDVLLVQLQQQTKRLARQAIEDPLTGLYNRRYLMEQLEVGVDTARENNTSLTVMIADLDDFKKINDTYSHAVGDDVLRSTAKILVENCRHEDIVARYGGEEFVIIFPNTPAGCATSVCERIRGAVERFDWAQFHPELKVSISMGVADERVNKFERLLAIADRRLYSAKHAGKNRVVDENNEGEESSNGTILRRSSDKRRSLAVAA